MRVLFTAPGDSVRIVDSERMILDLGNGNYYDIDGSIVPYEEATSSSKSCVSKDRWNQEWINYEGTSQPLISVSTVEKICEIDDIFGNYGFKNKKGEFVIEPQYACAHEFTCGLAAVNLNRTWFKINGERKYENHYGYIDEYGKTVIPFIYDEAWPFNKYGVAVAETLKESFLIDTAGYIIPGTENLVFSHYYDYTNRFFEFTYVRSNDDIPVGIYDTKERRIILDPIAEDFFECTEDVLLINEFNGETRISDFGEYYINSSGEVLYPWLYDKGFSAVERPNESLVAIVATYKKNESVGHLPGQNSAEENKRSRQYLYGLYSSNGRFIVPMKHKKIKEIQKNIFACIDNHVCTVIELDSQDF